MFIRINQSESVECSSDKKYGKKSTKLGIDGKYLNGEEEIFVLGDVEEKEFFGVTEDNAQSTLIGCLRKHFVNRGVKLEVVCMDMDRRIKGAVRSVDENVPIVVDKFHVISCANRVIDLCRIAVEKSNKDKFEIKRTLVMKLERFHQIKQQTKDFPGKNPKWDYKIKKFESIMKTHPEIKILWDLKNKLHGFYKCESKQTALKAWNELHHFLEQQTETHPELKDLKKTLTNWQEEILNYFTYRITNAYIEGINNRIETLKRKKFGFRNKLNFLKSLCYMLFPISHIFNDLIFTHLY